MKIRFDLENPYSAKFCRYNVPYGDSYDDGYESGNNGCIGDSCLCSGTCAE